MKLIKRCLGISDVVLARSVAFGQPAVASEIRNKNLEFSSVRETSGEGDNGHGLVEQDLGRIVIMEGFVMELVSIIVQHSSNSLDPMMESLFKFGSLNFIQERLNAIKKIHWPSELLSC
jgi:hypothetical protein